MRLANNQGRIGAFMDLSSFLILNTLTFEVVEYQHMVIVRYKFVIEKEETNSSFSRIHKHNLELHLQMYKQGSIVTVGILSV